MSSQKCCMGAEGNVVSLGLHWALALSPKHSHPGISSWNTLEHHPEDLQIHCPWLQKSNQVFGSVLSFYGTGGCFLHKVIPYYILYYYDYNICSFSFFPICFFGEQGYQQKTVRLCVWRWSCLKFMEHSCHMYVGWESIITNIITKIVILKARHGFG